MHMIIKFESFILTCVVKYGLNTFKTPQRQKFESKQHLEALALVDASYKVDSYKIWISTLCGRP